MRREYLAPDALPALAQLNEIKINGVQVDHVGGIPLDAGLAVKFQAKTHDPSVPFFRIPDELLLCHQNIEEYAKNDNQLREVLIACRPFTLTARGATMVYIVMKVTQAAGTRSFWNEYFKFLPAKVPLPTNWTIDERQLLSGTSLGVAVSAKLISLENEFETFKNATDNIRWCQDVWWTGDGDEFTLCNWRDLDALYRSRVLELPELGACMVPYLDFCNHSKDSIAYYDYDIMAQIITLNLKDTSLDLKEGQEITISYGESKSAAEMLFSYGFIEEHEEFTSSIVVDLRDVQTTAAEDADSHIYIAAKTRLLQSPPNLKIERTEGGMTWTSDLIWLLSVNQDDGFEIKVVQEIDGTRDIQALLDGKPLTNLSALPELLASKPLFDIYKLRALTLIEENVQRQISNIDNSYQEVDILRCHSNVFEHALHVSCKLKKLEKDLLIMFSQYIDNQKQELLESKVVLNYLKSLGNEGELQALNDSEPEDVDLT